MNKVFLEGNLCQDNELNNTQSGSLLKNTIAVRNDYKNQSGTYDSQFIKIEAWKSTAEFLAKYTGKGSRVLLEGKLINKSYDDEEGKKRYSTYVNIEKVHLIDTKKQAAENKEKPLTKIQEEQKILDSVVNGDPFEEFGASVVITDDDLPF